jgi:hypothetical protein
MTDTLEEKQEKKYALRIKPLVMKRRWRGLYIKRNTNYDKEQHIEALLSLIPLDEGEVVKSCSPPNVEEVIISMMNNLKVQLNMSMHLLLLHTKTKRWSFFSHTDGLMKVPFDMVDDPIDTFIQTGTCKWDLSCLKFDRDPIYDNEGSSQEIWGVIIRRVVLIHR